MIIIRKKLELTVNGTMQRYGWFFEPDDDYKPKHWQEFPIETHEADVEEYDSVARESLLELI